MDGLRIIAGKDSVRAEPCGGCGTAGQVWDRIAGVAYCPDCEEALARGDGPPLVLRTQKQFCCVCRRQGTVRYQTLPLGGTALLEMDLCPEHFRALLGR